MFGRVAAPRQGGERGRGLSELARGGSKKKEKLSQKRDVKMLVDETAKEGTEREKETSGHDEKRDDDVRAAEIRETRVGCG